MILAWASVAGALLQFLVQLPTAIALTRPLRVSLETKSADVQRVSKNFAPVLTSRGVVQISGYIDQWLASFLPGGVVATLSYAQTIYLLPVSLFGMAVSAAELPEMSRAVGSEEQIAAQLRARIGTGLRQIAYFVIPSAMAFLALGDVIAALLFQNGGLFKATESMYAWGILAGSAVGLLASTLGRLYSATYYALHDTRTPLRFALVRVGLTTILGALFAFEGPRLLGIDQRWGAAGLTSSAGIAGWVEFTLLRSRLNQRIGVTGLSAGFVGTLWGAALAAAAAGWAMREYGLGASTFVTRALVLLVFGVVYLAAHPRARRSGGSQRASTSAKAEGLAPRVIFGMALKASVLDKIAYLPESPGVYLWRDADGTVLYVGKAKRLRSRVRNYIAADHAESVKTQALMIAAADLDTIVVPSEAHALILEANLIKEHRPKYNIALRDDKSYPYIKVTVAEPFPRVLVTRRLIDDGSQYFGPYTDVGAMRRALNVVKRLFTVRSCNYDMPKQMPERPCLDYFIHRCKAPCILAQTQSEYAAMIDEVLVFLEGRTDEVARRVRRRMDEAATSLDFEGAAELRDALHHLESMAEPTVVLSIDGGDRDVLGYARDGDDAAIALMRIRGGKLLAREQQFLENIEGETDAAALELYLAGSYLAARRPRGGAPRPVRPRRTRARRGIARAHEDHRAAARPAP